MRKMTLNKVYKHNFSNTTSMHYQWGGSILGMAIITAIILLMIVIAMKVVPAYTEFAAIKSILTTMDKTGAINGKSKSEIVSAFNKRAAIENIESIRGNDLVVSTDSAGRTVVSVEYQVVRPVMGNASALIDFTATTEGL